MLSKYPNFGGRKKATSALEPMGCINLFHAPGYQGKALTDPSCGG